MVWYFRNSHRNQVLFGINFIDTVQIKYWPIPLWEKCAILLINKTKLLLKWKKHLHHCNSIYWFLRSFAKRCHSIPWVLVCTARWMIGYPICLQRILISDTRFLDFIIIRNWLWQYAMLRLWCGFFSLYYMLWRIFNKSC